MVSKPEKCTGIDAECEEGQIWNECWEQFNAWHEQEIARVKGSAYLDEDIILGEISVFRASDPKYFYSPLVIESDRKIAKAISNSNCVKFKEPESPECSRMWDKDREEL